MTGRAMSFARRATSALALVWRRLTLMVRLAVTAAWRAAQRTGLRTRLAAGASLALIAVLAWLGVSTASLASQARTDTQALIAETARLNLNSLTEAATYVQLADRSEQARQTSLRLKGRVRLLRPVELVPGFGGRIRATRNTVELGLEVSSAATIVLTAYGYAVDDRRTGGAEAVSAAMVRHADALENAGGHLVRARQIASGSLVLTARETTLVSLSIGVLQTMTTIALQDPVVVDDGLQLLSVVTGLQALVRDPLEALLFPEEAVGLISELRARSDGLADRLTGISETSGPEGEPISLALDGLAVLGSASEAAAALLSIADTVQVGPLSERFGAEIGPKLLTARLEIRQADELLDVLQSRFGGGLGAELSDALNLAPEGVFAPARQILAETAGVIDATWSLLGYGQPRTYLLILQNQQEIRATGGFIGATVEVHIDSGVLGDLVADDSVLVDRRPLVDNPVPPEPLFWYLWMGRLLFRDSNWSPHFPDAALQVAELYRRGHPVEIDGVIAATKLFGLDLVGTLGDVEVPGWDGPLDRAIASQLTEGELAYPCREDHAANRAKRCFDEDLVPALLDSMRSGLGEAQRIDVLKLLLDHLDRKTILFNFADPSAQALIAANDWDGAVPKTQQDLIMVVDSSFPGHTTADVQREVDYRVALSTAGPSKADLRVRYANKRPPGPDICRQSSQALLGGCYWNYFRVLLPEGARDLQGPSVPLHEGAERLIWGYREIDSGQTAVYGSGGLEGLQEVGGFIAVAPGRVITIPIVYELKQGLVQPRGSGRFEYRLQLVKQPGMDGDIYDVSIGLPQGAKLITASPPEASFDGRVVRLTTVLKRDMELVVVFDVP